MNNKEVKRKNKNATNVNEYFKNNIKSFLDYLMELYEFQEGIKVTYKIVERGVRNE